MLTKGIQTYEVGSKKQPTSNISIFKTLYGDAYLVLAWIEEDKEKVFYKKGNLEKAIEHVQKAIDFIKNGPGFKKNVAHMQKLYSLYCSLLTMLLKQGKHKNFLENRSKVEEIDWSSFSIPLKDKKEFQDLLLLYKEATDKKNNKNNEVDSLGPKKISLSEFENIFKNGGSGFFELN